MCGQSPDVVAGVVWLRDTPIAELVDVGVAQSERTSGGNNGGGLGQRDLWDPVNHTGTERQVGAGGRAGRPTAEQAIQRQC